MRKFLRVIFSRYALSALFILAELFIIAYFIFYAYAYSLVFGILSAVVDILVIISLINRDTNPEFKLTWLAVVTLIPLLGGALYIIFYSRRLTKKEARVLSEITLKMKENMREAGDEEYSLTNLGKLARISEVGAGRAFSILKDDTIAGLYAGSDCRYYGSGEEFFESVQTELRKAKKYIFLEYFIVEDGVMWQGIYKILLEKIGEGVEVRMLYDDIGSMSTVPMGFAGKLSACGIKCRRFAKVNSKLTSSHNNRDHRKICVIDGECAFTGGVNIADEYINEKKRFGHWKDGGIKVTGDAARGFTRLFLMMYDFTVGKVSDYSYYLAPVSEQNTETEIVDINTDKKEPTENNTHITERKGYLIPFGSGPLPAYSEPVGKNILMNMIDIATRYLYITTPYLIIDYELTEALRNAAKRGVDVRIITPHIADKKIIKIMTKSAYPYLLHSGVRIFEYTPGFIHEKLVVSDDRYAVVGTINFDYRSLVHHFEDGIWMFLDPEIEKMRDSFLSAEGKSHEILESEAKLGIFEKIVRSLIRIFAPLL